MDKTSHSRVKSVGTSAQKDGHSAFPLHVKVVGEKPTLRTQVSPAAGIELLPGEARDLTVRWLVEGSAARAGGDWRLVVSAAVNATVHSHVLIAFTSGLASTISNKPSPLDAFLKVEIVTRPGNSSSDVWCALDVRVSHTPGLRSLSFDLEAVSGADIDHFRQLLTKDRSSPADPIYTHKYVYIYMLYLSNSLVIYIYACIIFLSATTDSQYPSKCRQGVVGVW